MRRRTIAARPGWQETVSRQGLAYFRKDDPAAERDYWTEAAYYEFSSREIDLLERAVEELERMCLRAVERVVSRGMWDMFGIPQEFASWVTDSWRRQEPAFYGRYDLGYDGINIKLLEYNADTPTGLVEAAIIQWYWFKDNFPDGNWDQWNSLHERLIEAWRERRNSSGGKLLHLTSVDDGWEDYLTASYLRDTAEQAGWRTQYLPVDQLGWNPVRKQFTDERERNIEQIFKLYPWEWLFREQFGANLTAAPTRWVEPPWKAILSNKALLVLLYEMFPTSPYILPATFDGSKLGTRSWVCKPQFGREGANTRVAINGTIVDETGGNYSMEWARRPVYQEAIDLPQFDGNYAVLGAWVVDGKPAGMGIREAERRITTNHSHFVPHVIR